MTLLQPHLGHSRRQELRNSPFWPSLFRSHSHTRMEKTSSFKKAPPKIHRVLDPIKSSPFVVPTTIRKEAPTGNTPMGAIPPKAVINRFPQVGEIEQQRLQRSLSTPFKRTREWKPLFPMTSLPQSTSRRSPLFFQKRLALKQMLDVLKHYHQWLRSSSHLKTRSELP